MFPTPIWALALTLFAGVAQAQSHAGHGHHAPASSPPAASTAPTGDATALPWVEAEIRRVDLAAGKLSLRHGEIPNLSMPPMTMVFHVADPTGLDRLKPGDRVRVRAEQREGRYTVVAWEPLPPS